MFSTSSFSESGGMTFPEFEGGFTPWEHLENIFQYPQEPAFLNSNITEPVFSNSSGSDEVVQKEPDEANQPGSIIDERRAKRKISNRESARRSREKKQKQAEDLNRRANQFKAMNQELRNRLNSVMQYCQLVQRENRMLVSESMLLRQRLQAMHQVLLARDIELMQYKNKFTNITDEFSNFNQNLHLLNL